MGRSLVTNGVRNGKMRRVTLIGRSPSDRISARQFKKSEGFFVAADARYWSARLTDGLVLNRDIRPPGPVTRTLLKVPSKPCSEIADTSNFEFIARASPRGAKAA